MRRAAAILTIGSLSMFMNLYPLLVILILIIAIAEPFLSPDSV